MSDLDRALWKLEEAIAGVQALSRATGYGLRLASKRVGDLAVSSAAGRGGNPSGTEELSELAEALESGTDQLSDVLLLSLGDHFREYLRRALELPDHPSLPGSVAGVEELAGTPGALARCADWFWLGLLLYRAALNGGAVEQRALLDAGVEEVEIPSFDGKVRLYRSGDRATLSESQLGQVGEAYLEAARAIRQHLGTS